jgi:hypothetical protein
LSASVFRREKSTGGQAASATLNAASLVVRTVSGCPG